ncbi:hypothetical protein ACF1AX_36860 [Streptomyces sp. NPDC014802]|uniref:effector-associated constant component EACC1 n=1 Tax=unclassified Streptomyces TaxID=2593676 RepID=UPI0036FA0719
MRIRIESDGDEQSLTDLREWLGQDPKARSLDVTPVSGDGPTMSVLHALDVALGHGLDIGNFAVAYASWRLARGTAHRGARRLTYGATTVDIGHLSPKELAELLRRLENEDADSATPTS